MASTNKTPNLDLPQWEATDKPERVDFNDAMLKVDTEVAAHKAESAKKHIHSSGSGANGYWIKYDNGYMEQWKSVSISVDVTYSWGSLYISSTARISLGNFEEAFLTGTVPTVIACLSSSKNDGFLSAIRSTTNTYVGSTLIIRGTSGTDLDYTIDVFAKGRWK